MNIPRVLHVLEPTIGGTRAYMSALVRAINQDVFKCGLVYSTQRADSGWPAVMAEAEKRGWYLCELPMFREVKPLSDALCAWRLRQIARTFGAQIIHGHSSKAGALARLAALATNAKVIYSPHGIAVHLGRPYEVIERLLAPITSHFVAVSDSERAKLLALRLASPDRISVVCTAIDTPAQATPYTTVADQVPIVAGIGRLVPEKNPLAFVDLVALLNSGGRRVRGVWVGDGELRPQMEERVRAHGLGPLFEITGWCLEPSVQVGRAAVVVSTSVSEGLSVAIAEAFALGRPVVASAITGTTDIMEGDLSRWLYTSGYLNSAAGLVAQLLADENGARQV